ncbi:hypothetical protein [Psychromonas ossibalaenae]|uniref:hypothetical protein n=1 Tax=Psychromonas ossibalaenae TaxID=444922 RepID=UPI000382667B|nr:hypothetical protein [Psychromonas ossibalaenae]
MKLEKRLYIAGEEMTLASHMVSLKLSLGSVAIFTIADTFIPEKHQAVRFDIGYESNLKPFFEGYIEKVQPAENGHYRMTVKENVGILSNRWPLSVEHPTMREVLTALGEKTGLQFILPEEVDYTDKQIPNFVSQGTGYQCLQQIGRAFKVPDLVWFQHTDQSVHIGAYQDCRFYGKPVTVPLDLSSRANGDNMTFAPFPMLRPGALIKDEKLTEKRLTRLDLIGDEMTAYWGPQTNSVPAKKHEIFKFFPELATQNHLPKFGRVEAVRDTASAGQTADPFRPRYAIDIQLLTESLQADLNVPVYKSIPMPVHMSGHESGLLAYPLEGTIVEIAFAYGRNDLPIIRGIYGRDYALPDIEPGEQLQQQRIEVSQKTDAAGNTTEQTDQQQSQQAFKQYDQADEYLGEFGKHTLTISQHSIEEIIGQKVIEALGAIDLLAGDDLTLGSLGNMQVATAGELITTIGKLRNVVVTLDDKLKVMGNKMQTIEKNFNITAENITQDATTIKLNGGAGVCTGASICPFTGSPHVDISTTVFAGK